MVSEMKCPKCGQEAININDKIVCTDCGEVFHEGDGSLKEQIVNSLQEKKETVKKQGEQEKEEYISPTQDESRKKERKESPKNKEVKKAEMKNDEKKTDEKSQSKDNLSYDNDIATLAKSAAKGKPKKDNHKEEIPDFPAEKSEGGAETIDKNEVISEVLKNTKKASLEEQAKTSGTENKKPDQSSEKTQNQPPKNQNKKEEKQTPPPNPPNDNQTPKTETSKEVSKEESSIPNEYVQRDEKVISRSAEPENKNNQNEKKQETTQNQNNNKPVNQNKNTMQQRPAREGDSLAFNQENGKTVFNQPEKNTIYPSHAVIPIIKKMVMYLLIIGIVGGGGYYFYQNSAEIITSVNNVYDGIILYIAENS